MRLKIVCSGYLVRFPVGGHVWHHLQYVVGLRRLGHEVIYFENFGWPNSCYNPPEGAWTSNPLHGIRYLLDFLRPLGAVGDWCYLSEDGTSHGISRAALSEACKECDLYLDLSYMNWIPELERCRNRALIDTDPVFTQIGGHGAGGPLPGYRTRFTFGENVHQPGCSMPAAGVHWTPTRQPMVLDLWPATRGNTFASFSTVMNWSAYGDRQFDGRIYGQKDRQFASYFDLPSQTCARMELAISGPGEIRDRLAAAGWRMADPAAVSATPWTYQKYLQRSKAEFSVAKHAYVSTQCGWFSDRSAAYLASGRPTLIEDTGFSRRLPCGLGLVPFRTRKEALAGIDEIQGRYEAHCRAAREIAREYFDSGRVLTGLLDIASVSRE